VKVDRREEMTDLDDDATDGQVADFLAAEISGDARAWSVGVIEYYCAGCDAYYQIQDEELTNYKSLIVGWHERAAEGDYFSRFVFEYLAFIAHLKNNIYFAETRDRNVIQNLKQDFGRRDLYVRSVLSNDELSSFAQEPAQQTFPTAEVASDALFLAAQSGNEQVMVHILAGGKELVSSGESRVLENCMHGLSGGRWPASGKPDAPPPTRH
jgi:hypothetical protein